VVPFTAIGLFARRGRPGARGELLLAVLGLHAIVFAGLSLYFGYTSRRHLLPPLTLLLGYAAIGAREAGVFLARRLPGGAGRSPATARRACTVGLVLLATAPGLGRALTPDRLDSLAERRAAEWLRREQAPTEAVGCGKQRLAYYAGAPFYPLREPPGPARLFWRLRKHGVRYLVMPAGQISAYPSLASAFAEDGIRLLHCEEAAGETACVYEVAAPGTTGAPARPGG
jgi:hypothetical protein